MVGKGRLKYKDIVLLLAAVVIILLLVIVFKNGDSNNDQTTANGNSAVAIAASGIKYPTDWREASQISVTDKDNGVISKASRDNPSANVVVRSDNAVLAKNGDINSLPTEVVNKLKTSLNDFSLVKASVVNIGKTQAIRVDYKNTSGSFIYQNSQIIIPTESKSFYLLISAVSSEYAGLNSDIDKISEAFASYAAGQK